LDAKKKALNWLKTVAEQPGCTEQKQKTLLRFTEEGFLYFMTLFV